MAHAALLTVGSTAFTPLVTAFLSPPTLSALAAQGITSILAQVGNSTLPPSWIEGTRLEAGIEVTVVRLLGDLEEKVRGARIVVSHAGAGSILSFLRPHPSSNPPANRHLILVPNTTLMDSHQSDLADELSSKGWARVSSPSELVRTIEQLDTAEVGAELCAGFDKSKLGRIMDQTIGFIV